MLNIVKKIAKKILGVRDFQDQLESYYSLKFRWFNDPKFNHIYNFACERTETPGNFLHKIRSYTALEFLKTAPVGEIAECGTYRGTLAYEMRMIKDQSIYLFDSFEGISGRQEQDLIRNATVGGDKGAIACDLDTVVKNLSDFPDFIFCKGWIPERFHEVADKKFAFVYVDVDVYQPTRDSFDFFYPLLVPGGIIMCDDYGFNTWPGCKKAVDEMALKHGFTVIPLSSGQCVVIKK